ncbi:hypothetical protein Golax_016597 [Gossypium laxum]|uniref:Uncharacterized protein n=2 Tax=Gossypium TaxID=3633 RepID=A0A7J8L8G8_9ROSI|nr:hypothetical protein [Gossypium lobatum]MBA0704332.1 hypothetical protein [Gossypium laxum]
MNFNEVRDGSHSIPSAY